MGFKEFKEAMRVRHTREFRLRDIEFYGMYRNGVQQYVVMPCISNHDDSTLKDVLTGNTYIYKGYGTSRDPRKFTRQERIALEFGDHGYRSAKQISGGELLNSKLVYDRLKHCETQEEIDKICNTEYFTIREIKHITRQLQSVGQKGLDAWNKQLRDAATKWEKSYKIEVLHAKRLEKVKEEKDF